METLMKTIVDLGAFDGSDTEYYLRKGFRVIAIEADEGFSNSILKKIGDHENLILKTIAITNARKKVTFYKNMVKKDWSSLIKDGKATQHTHRVMEVQGDTLDNVLKGEKIYFMKMDIEGGEINAVAALKRLESFPEYLSFELGRNSSRILEMLIDYGYNEFQLIKQGPKHFLPQPNPAREGEYVDIKFHGHMSGIFGKDLPEDEWLSYDKLKEKIDYIKKKGISWNDIHCRMSK